MAMICGSFEMLDESSSLRRIGRSNSTLVESELVTSEVVRITAYEKLSQSMRLTHESNPNNHQQRCKKNRPWTSVFKAFSNKNVGSRNFMKRQTTVKTVAEPPQVAAGDANKRRSSWFPDPHRRWPVQGW